MALFWIKIVQYCQYVFVVNCPSMFTTTIRIQRGRDLRRTQQQLRRQQQQQQWILQRKMVSYCLT